MGAGKERRGTGNEASSVEHLRNARQVTPHRQMATPHLKPCGYPAAVKVNILDEYRPDR
jgi:hypothetical protein